MPPATTTRRMTAAEMRRLCDAPASDTLLGLRDRALLATLASSGCRVAEVVTLEREQICNAQYIYIELPQGKQLGARQAPLSREACECIEAWLARRSVPSRYVFTRFDGRGGSRTSAQPMSTTSVWRTVQRYAEQAGIEDVSTQTFRWFVGAELMRRHGLAEAQRVLGLRRAEAARRYGHREREQGLTDGLY